MTFLCILTSLLVLAVLIRCLAFVGRPACLSMDRSTQMAGLATVLVMTAFLMRPHEHVFQGLDSSAYRLMEQAMESGRGLLGVDTVLMEVPQAIRRDVLLLPDMSERNSRDRSFEITSLKTGTYKPFFYPLLPMVMRGLDVLVPGRVADYFVPLCSSLFCGTLVLWAVSRMGVLGCLAVPSLLLASPLPAWLMRGCYVETVSGILLATAMMTWINRQKERAMPVSAYAALGLAVSFHPVMMIPAICLAGPMLMTESSVGRIARGIGLSVCGVIPIVWLTLRVSQPYGSLSWDDLMHGASVSPSIQSAFIGAAAAAVIVVVLLGLRVSIMAAITRLNKGYAGLALSIVLVLAALVPTLLAAECWEQKAIVRQGLFELETGLKMVPSIILAVLGLLALLLKGPNTPGLLAVGLSLPMFLYLKGAEQMGLWSQRRLIAPYLMYLTAILPTLCWLLVRVTVPGRLRVLRIMVCVGMLIVLGVGNGIGHLDTWIAPYVIRYEQGADRWVNKQKEAIGPRLTVSDAFGFTVPLAVDGKTRIVGLGEKAMSALPAVMTWLADRARAEDVLWLTASENPAMEDGVQLVPFQPPVTQVLWRARAKWALPAIREKIEFKTQLLSVVPLREGDHPVMDKIMDSGVLGLRKPWGRGDVPIKLAGGVKLPAMWSREDSGIIGPVPAPGASVRMTVYAVNARVDDVLDQALMIYPPWGGAPAVVSIPREYGPVQCDWVRTNTTQDAAILLSGVYRIKSTKPYDPENAGLKNFKRDLGALIHRIKIEVLPTDPL